VDLVRRLLSENGGVAGVIAKWPFDPAPNRSAFSRWLDGKTVPKSAHQLLSLSAALDVDPFALWAPDLEKFDRVVTQVTHALRKHQWGKLYAALAFIEQFNGPIREWPPERLANTYYRRPWFTHDFQHANVETLGGRYETIRLQPAVHRDFHDPQMFHFAWRDGGRPVSDWRPYGIVEVCRGNSAIRLLNYNGLIHEVYLAKGHLTVAVETFFGPRSADFRIASLHPFRVVVGDLPKLEPGTPIIRFL